MDLRTRPATDAPNILFFTLLFYNCNNVTLSYKKNCLYDFKLKLHPNTNVLEFMYSLRLLQIILATIIYNILFILVSLQNCIVNCK